MSICFLITLSNEYKLELINFNGLLWTNLFCLVSCFSFSSFSVLCSTYLVTPIYTVTALLALLFWIKCICICVRKWKVKKKKAVYVCLRRTRKYQHRHSWLSCTPAHVTGNTQARLFACLLGGMIRTFGSTERYQRKSISTQCSTWGEVQFNGWCCF